MKRASKLAVLIFLALVSGFYQEKLKISINYILEQGARTPGFFEQTPDVKYEWIEHARVSAPFDYYHNHQTITWLYHFDSRQLLMLKWGVTGFFLLWFLMLNILLLRTLSISDEITRYIPLLYGSLILISLILYGAGSISGQHQIAYTLSRRVMGALQSVIPVLIIWPASRLWNRSKKESSL
jgi:hypothetical protein